MNTLTLELVSPPTSNTNNDTSTIGAENTILQEVTEPKQNKVNTRKQDRKDKRRERKEKRKENLNKEDELLSDNTTSKPAITEKLTWTEVNVTTPVSTNSTNTLTSENKFSTTKQPSTTEKQTREVTPLPLLDSTVGMFSTNNGVKVVTPEFIRKLQEQLQAKFNQIQQDVANFTRNISTTTLPTTKAIVPDATTILNKTSPTTTTTETPETKTKSVKDETTVSSATTIQPINTKSTTVENKQQSTKTPSVSQTTSESRVFETSTSNSFLGNITISKVDVSSPTQSNNGTDITDDKTEDDTKVTSETAKSGLIIVQENKSNSTDVNDIDIIIFPSSRADEKKRRRERRKFCKNIDFGAESKGVNCCKKALNCFDELPETLDETIFHHANPNYNEAERIHVCHHIDDSFTCIGTVMEKSSCQDTAQILDNKIKPQLDKVKLFYYNTCNRGPTLMPPVGTNTTVPRFPPRPPRTNNERGFKENPRTYAPFIGGAIIGLFALMVIILFTVYCRKRNKKRKKNKEKRREKGNDSTESSRYKTVSYTRRRSDIYAEIDEQNMVSTISCGGHSCSNDGSCYSSSLIRTESDVKTELDNNGYLSPQPSFPEDNLKPDIAEKDKEGNLFTHGYIELKAGSDDSAQSYAKLEPDPEDDYIQADKIESSPNRTSKKADEQGHMYFVLEKNNKNENADMDEN